MKYQLNTLKSTSLKKKSILTDKTTLLFVLNKYSFLVSKIFNKLFIKKLFEQIFNTSIQKINTLLISRRINKKLLKSSKKILLTLKKKNF
jgi:ribosomal protein L23